MIGRKNNKLMRKMAVMAGVMLASAFAVLLPMIPRHGQSQQSSPVTLPGQSATLLPDGRWLLLGGESANGVLGTASIWDPRTGVTLQLPTNLQQQRAWHTATVLPDGTILILGGVGASNTIVGSAEKFDPENQMFSAAPLTEVTPRARHTATLLLDGHLLITGGVDSTGQTLASAELWKPLDTELVTQLSNLSGPRRNHSASLTDTGTVLLRGGLDDNGNALDSGELFDPLTQRFSVVDSVTINNPIFSATPYLAASMPSDKSLNVPTDIMISLRFSKPIRVDTLNIGTITLSGPKGIETVTVVPAETGMLVFIEPQTDLLPGATYALTLNGVADKDGLLLPMSGISFSTAPLPGESSTSTASSPFGTRESSEPQSFDRATEAPRDDDFEWKGPSKNGKPYSEWQDLPALQAPPNVTALAGQVLDLRGLPLANVRFKFEDEYGGTSPSTQTDETGRFLIAGVEEGRQVLIIDGALARRRVNGQSSTLGPQENHGVFEYGTEIKQGETNILPFTIWLPKIDTAHTITIPSPTTSELVITTPHIPLLEVHIPAGAVIKNHEGNIVTEVGITSIPLDRTPFPMPENTAPPPAFFTIQPGGSYVYAAESVKVIYPNYKETPLFPGYRTNFFHYDPDYRGWYLYSRGKVTTDRKQIVPDRGIRKFTGQLTCFELPPPEKAPCTEECGDPVDLFTGSFIHEMTDLFVSDVIPISLKRVHRSGDTESREFGIGAAHGYSAFFWDPTFTFNNVSLILADGSRLRYNRTSGNSGSEVGTWEHTETPTAFFKSTITYSTGDFGLPVHTLRFKDGTSWRFAGDAIRGTATDRNGNQLVGGIQHIKFTSPNGRYINFIHDNLTGRITQATDNIGRTVLYTYDASGRLWKVTDPENGVTEYSYDTSHRITSIKDPRGNIVVENIYDANGRVQTQKLAPGTPDEAIYQFAYTVDQGTGKVTQTDVTDPRGYITSTTFNSSGYKTSQIRALGTPEEQTFIYIRQPGTNLITRETDAMGRHTDYVYDAGGMGNVTSVTRAVGLPEQATTTYTYEPTYNQVATITNPLGAGHTTTFTYGSIQGSYGNVIRIDDSLGNWTTFGYNSAGQQTSVATPAGTTTLTYELGDLIQLKDPLNNITSRFYDGIGRLVSQTDGKGQRTLSEYDKLSRTKKITDPQSGLTQFAYDPNGNLVSVTDARNNATTYTYDTRNRLKTRKDPLPAVPAENYQYDVMGNLQAFTNRKLQTTTYLYDPLNRRKKATFADLSTTDYIYDNGNRLRQILDSLSGNIIRDYDNLDRMTLETTPQGTVTYSHDAAGRRTAMTVTGQSNIIYGYDNGDRITSITQGSSNVGFGYDASNRRTSVTLPNGIVTQYGYDAASRVTSLTYSRNSTMLGNLMYEYDQIGNRSKIGGSWARTGLPEPLSTSNYNEANQQLTVGDKTMTFDNNGNLSTLVDGSGTTFYTWNARNQLTAISGPGVNANFIYDGVGRREKKTVNGNLTEFLHDGTNPVQETSGTTVLANILTGLESDELFVRTDVAILSDSNFLQDHLGNAIALSNASGTVQTEYTFDPFGKVTFSGASNSNPFQYTSRENDGTGLYYYRARYYHPMLQRFLSEDPLAYSGGSSNFYLYVTNNPVNFVDPTGMRVLVLPSRCGSSLPGYDLMRKLIGMSECASQTILLHSGQRSPQQNKCAGGASNSQHLGSGAADISIPGWSPEQLAEMARCVGFRGIITYDAAHGGHTHVDMRPVSWYGHNGNTAPFPKWWNNPVCCCLEE